MYKRILLFFTSLIFFQFLYPQESLITGHVFDNSIHPLEGVSVYWINSSRGTITNSSGKFTLPFSDDLDTLVFQFLGYYTHKISKNDFTNRILVVELFEKPFLLPPYEVVAKSKEYQRLIPGKTEVIMLNAEPGMMASDISEVLRYQPGIQIIGNGTGGSLKTIKINGFSSSHVAFQLDGMTMNSAQNGGLDLSLINSESLESISIKYSGNSVDAGSSALGGVVNMSVLPERFNTSTRISMGIGSYENFSISGVQQIGNNSDSGLKAGFYYRAGQDGYSYMDELGNQQKVYNAAYTRQNFQLGGVINTGSNSNLKLFGTISNGFSQIPSISQYNKSEQKDVGGIIRATYKLRLSEESSFILGTGFNRSFLQYKNFNLDIQDEYTNDHTSVLINYLLSGISSQWRLITRFEGNYFRLNSTQISFKDEANFRFSTATRYGHEILPDFIGVGSAGISVGYTQYDGKYRFDYRAGIKGLWSIFELYSSIYSGYKIPTFNDRYWPGSGNPDLLVEESLNWVSGASIKPIEWFSVDADYTLLSTKNMIRWIPVDGTNWSPYNLDSANGQTLSLKMSAIIAKIKITGGITWQNIEKNGEQLRYIPELLGAFRISYSPISNLLLFAGNLFESDRPLVDGGLETGQVLTRYGIIDMGIEYQWKIVKLIFKANNITDELYYLQGDLPMKGRNFEAAITFQF